MNYLLLHRYAIRFPRIFALGWAESADGCGMTYDDDPSSPRSSAYDLGRNDRRHVWAFGAARRAAVEAWRESYREEMEA